MKPISQKEYAKMAQKASPSSPTGKNCLLAYITGGGICVLGQFLCNLYQQWGLSLPMARAGVSISLIFLSALLTGLGCFDNIARFAGAWHTGSHHRICQRCSFTCYGIQKRRHYHRYGRKNFYHCRPGIGIWHFRFRTLWNLFLARYYDDIENPPAIF